jgi:cobalamin-dependent methionine synthase I
MIIIGERINTSRSGVAPMVQQRDTNGIVEMARVQKEAGANLIDVNCGTLLENEADSLEWLVKTIQSELEIPLSLDSPNPVAISKALQVHNGKAMINSISLEKERLNGLLPIISEYECSVIALAMDDNGIPETVEERYAIACKLVEELTRVGLALNDIYLDPLVRPISTGEENGRIVLETIHQVMDGFPGIHTVCGLSNISYGLPERRLLNQAFLMLAMGAGLDAAIVDPLDRRLVGLMRAGETLRGNDGYCRQYLAAFRRGELSSIS